MQVRCAKLKRQAPAGSVSRFDPSSHWLCCKIKCTTLATRHRIFEPRGRIILATLSEHMRLLVCSHAKDQLEKGLSGDAARPRSQGSMWAAFTDGRPAQAAPAQPRAPPANGTAHGAANGGAGFEPAARTARPHAPPPKAAAARSAWGAAAAIAPRHAAAPVAAPAPQQQRASDSSSGNEREHPGLEESSSSPPPSARKAGHFFLKAVPSLLAATTGIAFAFFSSSYY